MLQNLIARSAGIAKHLLPDGAKDIIRPIYVTAINGCARVLPKVLSPFGRNYWSFDHDCQVIRIYYTPDTTRTFYRLISDGTIVREGVPLSIIDLTPDPDLIIDVGAHHGIYTVLMARLNPTSEVHAFEPGEYNRSVLQEVLSANNANVIVHPEVIAERAGTTTFFTGEPGSESHSTTRTDGFARVEKKTQSLSAFIAETGFQTVFVKIDIEGGEWPVLKDLLSAPANSVTGIVEFHPEKLECPVVSITDFLIDRCDEVRFITDTSPDHEQASVIPSEHNRPMYYFHRTNK